MIGHVVPLSGGNQEAGRRLVDAVAIAVEEENQNENDLPGRRPYTIVHGDTGDTIDGFRFQTVRLIDVNRASAIVGATTTEQLDRTIAGLSSHQLVVVSPAGGPTPSKNVFTVGLAPSEQGRCLARHMLDDTKCRHIVVATSLSLARHRIVSTAFEQELTKDDRARLETMTFLKAEEIPNLARRIAAIKPETVLISGTAQDFLAWQSALESPAMPSRLWIFAGEEGQTDLLRSSEKVRPFLAARAFDATDSTAKKFTDRYSELNRSVPSPEAALSYDAARIFFAAARSAKEFQASKIQAKLNDLTDLACVTGSFWFADDRTARRPVFITKISLNKSVTIRRFETPSKP